MTKPYKRRTPELHPAFDGRKKTVHDTLLEVLQAMDEPLDQSMKLNEAIDLFNEKLWALGDQADDAFDAWCENDDTLNELQDRLDTGDYKDDGEKDEIETKLTRLYKLDEEMKQRYQEIKDAVKDLEKQGEELKKKGRVKDKEVLAYFEHLKELLALSPLSGPIDE